MDPNSAPLHGNVDSPKRAGETTEDIERLQLIVENALEGRGYSNFRLFKTGSTRACFVADWGKGAEERIIKIDIPPQGPRSKRHVARGYTTSNDLNTLMQIKSAERHHISPLRDFRDLSDVGHEGMLIVEPYFESTNLEERINEEGPFNKKEFITVFSQILEAERYLLKDNGLINRDLGPGNILIGDNFETRITDLANACSLSGVSRKAFPTSGKHLITDPLLFSYFTGEQASYGEDSEIYAIGMNALLSIKGSPVIDCDPDNGTAVVCSTGEDLMKEGVLDIKRYEQVIRGELKTLPREFKKFIPIIQRSITLNRENRYLDIDELIHDFDLASNPTFWESIKQKRETIFVSGTVGAVLFTSLLAAVQFLPIPDDYPLLSAFKQKEVVSAKAQSYLVGADTNGEGIEITNNLVTIEPNLYVFGGPQDVRTTEGHAIYVKPGEEIHGSIFCKEIARPRDEDDLSVTPSLEGKVYIEGFEASDGLSVYPFPNDVSSVGMEMGTAGFDMINLKVPDNIPDGSYVLAIELYASEEGEETTPGYNKNIRFSEPGKVISRKRVPLIVGDWENTENHVGLEKMALNGYDNSLTIDHVEDTGYNHDFKINPNLTYEVSVPGENFSATLPNRYNSTSDFFSGLPLPKVKSEKESILQLVAKDGDTVVGYTFIPIKTKPVGDNYWWDFAIPGREFSEKIVDYRKSIYSRSKPPNGLAER